MKRKVTVEVPYKRAGNVISNRLVEFEVEEEWGAYKAVPLLNTDELRVANLPSEFTYIIHNGKAVSDRGIKEGNQPVIDAIVVALKETIKH